VGVLQVQSVVPRVAVSVFTGPRVALAPQAGRAVCGAQCCERIAAVSMHWGGVGCTMHQTCCGHAASMGVILKLQVDLCVL
jgi:riboflavin synthase